MPYGLTNEEAINAIKKNYPPENYTVLREALDMAIESLEKQAEIQNWANNPSGIKDMAHRSGYEHAQHDILCLITRG